MGSPRVVINGTCFDSSPNFFNPENRTEGRGFIIINGLEFNERGECIELETPYPGRNISSFASSGTLYIRNSHLKIAKNQLNGGRFAEVTEKDCLIMLPYLKENERFFNIAIIDLLTVNGELLPFNQIYRKIETV